MFKYIGFVLLAGFSFCNPKPPDPVPTPTPTPEPPPGHICVVDKEFCNCYVMVPGSDTWTLVSCSSGQECTEQYQCVTPIPVDPCKGITCAIGFHCENGLCVKDPVDPIPPPTTGNCPKQFTGSKIYMRNRRYGNGIDSTVRVYGDPEFCFAIHGVNVNDCHLDGWPNRAKCEMELLGGCPIWQFTVDEGKTIHRCNDNTTTSAMSCDHFGDPVFRDDPKTPEFEGRPIECGLQRDEFGPNAGFFTIAHGLGKVHACRPDGNECGSWVSVNH